MVVFPIKYDMKLWIQFSFQFIPFIFYISSLGFLPQTNNFLLAYFTLFRYHCQQIIGPIFQIFHEQKKPEILKNLPQRQSYFQVFKAFSYHQLKELKQFFLLLKFLLLILRGALFQYNQFVINYFSHFSHSLDSSENRTPKNCELILKQVIQPPYPFLLCYLTHLSLFLNFTSNQIKLRTVYRLELFGQK